MCVRFEELIPILRKTLLFTKLKTRTVLMYRLNIRLFSWYSWLISVYWQNAKIWSYKWKKNNGITISYLQKMLFETSAQDFIIDASLLKTKQRLEIVQHYNFIKLKTPERKLDFTLRWYTLPCALITSSLAGIDWPQALQAPLFPNNLRGGRKGRGRRSVTVELLYASAQI